MGLTPLIWQPAPQGQPTRDEDWPLVDDLLQEVQVIRRDPDRDARRDALQALIKAAFDP